METVKSHYPQHNGTFRRRVVSHFVELVNPFSLGITKKNLLSWVAIPFDKLNSKINSPFWKSNTSDLNLTVKSYSSWTTARNGSCSVRPKPEQDLDSSKSELKFWVQPEPDLEPETVRPWIWIFTSGIDSDLHWTGNIQVHQVRNFWSVLESKFRVTRYGPDLSENFRFSSGASQARNSSQVRDRTFSDSDQVQVDPEIVVQDMLRLGST